MCFDLKEYFGEQLRHEKNTAYLARIDRSMCDELKEFLAVHLKDDPVLAHLPEVREIAARNRRQEAEKNPAIARDNDGDMVKIQETEKDAAIKHDVDDDVYSKSDETSDLESQTYSEPHAEITRIKTTEDEREYPPMKKVIPITAALFLAMFLVALDRTIIATAIPKMTDEFNSFDDIGWYGAAYLLTMCSFQLLYGRIYTFYNPKTVFIVNVVLFEIGSVVCGSAPSSTAFIVGRAIAGTGSAGVMSGNIVVIMYLVPLAKRPLFQACFGAIFGLSSVVGPLLGGVFTDKVSWRWCFYLNLPIGAVALIVLAFLLEMPQHQREKLTFRQQLAKLDLVGTFFFIPGVVSFLLALQWGGGAYPWANWRIVLLFVLAGVLGSAFVAVQILRPDTATVPPRIMKQRSIIAGVCYSVCVGSSMMLIVYYSPLYLQAIKNNSAVESGILMIPMMMGLVVAAAVSGAVVQKTGYYTPSMIFCSIVMSIAAGLFLTLKQTSSRGTFIGFQVLFGIGLGAGLQQAGLAAQAVVARKDAPTAISLMFFGQSLGGAIFLSIGQTVLNNGLVSRLSNIVGFDAHSITNIGATELRSIVPAAALGTVLEAYNASLVNVFTITVALAACGLLAGAGMEWKNIKAKPKSEAPAAAIHE